MLEPFPENYVWNVHVNPALVCGGNPGEIDTACRPIREASARGDDKATAMVFDSWITVADRIAMNAETWQCEHEHWKKPKRSSAGLAAWMNAAIWL